MSTKAPLEYVWRPIAEAIDRCLDRPRPRHCGGLIIPLMLAGSVVFWTIFAVLVMQ